MQFCKSKKVRNRQFIDLKSKTKFGNFFVIKSVKIVFISASMLVTTVISPNIFSIKTLIFYLQLQFCKSEKESENRQFIDLKVQLLSYINQSQRIELNSESTKIITTQEKLCFTMKPCWLVKLDWCVLCYKRA